MARTRFLAHGAARIGRRARRSLALRWLLVAIAAGVAAVQADRLGASALEARRAWGRAEPVVVAARTIEAGELVGSDDVRVERWPLAMVPGGALHDPPADRRATATIAAGEAVLGARLAPQGLSAVAALVPAGWRALAIPVAAGFGAPVPPLSPGDRVDLLAPDVVVEAAVVVAVADDTVTVAVRVRDAPAVADAVVAGAVTIALRGADGA